MEDLFNMKEFKNDKYFDEYDREAFRDAYDALSDYLASEGK